MRDFGSADSCVDSCQAVISTTSYARCRAQDESNKEKLSTALPDEIATDISKLANVWINANDYMRLQMCIGTPF